MPIVSHTLQSFPQADGSTQNTLTMLDESGNPYTVSFPAPAGFDLEARVQTAIADQNEWLSQREFEQITGLG